MRRINIVSREVSLTHVMASRLCTHAQEVASFALEKFQPRVVSFEEQVWPEHDPRDHNAVSHAPWLLQVSIIREAVAKVYEAEESWTQAAQMLAGIDLDSGQRVLDAKYKLGMCIRIAQLFLVSCGHALFPPLLAALRGMTS